MIPHVSTAKAIEKAIQAVVPDIRLLWDRQRERWVVAQIKQNPGGILLPAPGSVPSQYRTNTLYVVQDPDTRAYRAPSHVDVQLAIRIGQFGRTAIEKGGDWLIDQLEAKERDNREATDNRHRERIKAVMPDLKRAVRNSKTHWMGQRHD